MKKIDCKKTFGIDCDFEVLAFKERSEYVPVLDENYLFDPKTTLAILAGFSFNQRVVVRVGVVNSGQGGINRCNVGVDGGDDRVLVADLLINLISRFLVDDG